LTTASNSDLRLLGELEIARRISLMAACCCDAS
jgi:hypothetical protein